MNKGGMWTWIAGISMGLLIIIWAIPQFTKQQDTINVAAETQDNSMEIDKLTMQIASSKHFFREDPEGLTEAKNRLFLLRSERKRQIADKNDSTGQIIVAGQPLATTPQQGLPVPVTQSIVISESKMKEMKAKAMSGIR